MNEEILMNNGDTNMDNGDTKPTANDKRKRVGELDYWSKRKDAEGTLENSWFEYFYTSHFDLTTEDYIDKRVLDVGCGPRGSLEWANMARERVGVDPLADDYLALGSSSHTMTYVAAEAESIPYPDGHFDIVCSFNSLDHLNDLHAVVAEMKRLTAVGGLLLVLTDVHEEPTPQEPICFDWDVINLFSPEFAVQSVRCLEKLGNGLYAGVEQNILFNHASEDKRYGVLSARFMRVNKTKPQHEPLIGKRTRLSLTTQAITSRSWRWCKGSCQRLKNVTSRSWRWSQNGYKLWMRQVRVFISRINRLIRSLTHRSTIWVWACRKRISAVIPAIVRKWKRLRSRH